jgi:lipoprotein LprG
LKIRKTRLVIPAILPAVCLLLLLAACGGPDNLPADQIIGKAVPAINNVNTFHFTLSTSKVQKPPPGIFITAVDGDVQKPDKLVGSVNAAYSGIPVKINVVVDGANQFWTDPASGKWGPMPAELNMATFFDPSKGMADILSNVQGLTADGTENIDGTDTYRLKGTVPATALKSLTSEVTATGNISTTLWIGSGDFLLRKASLTGPLLSDEPPDIERTITIKDYNKAVKVETPVIH